MSTKWGVYSLQGRLADGTVVDESARAARVWFVRWRVDGSPRKRTFKQKGHAQTFRKHLLQAQTMGWPADERGWPPMPTPGLDAVQSQPAVAPGEMSPTADRGVSFETYCNEVWYPLHKDGWSDKNRIGHRDNMRLAIEVLRYQPNDSRLRNRSDIAAGDSILLEHLVPDDVLRAVSVRARTNGRTAAVNARRVAKALAAGVTEIELAEERASEATVRAFYVTLSMILKAAERNTLILGDPLDGTAKKAPKPRPTPMSRRIVPSVDEVFDLSEAIASLGPVGPGGRPAGDRFRALVLCGGTLAPRPGELTAHRPEWIDWDDPVVVRFYETEAAIYDPEEGIRGRQVHHLKHRVPGDWREVPALAAVADALRVHFERGYASPDRTFTSVSGTANLDWHNLTDTYWRPACLKVFGKSAKPGLAQMTPNVLRKAAITFWLDSGITPHLASEWAGHSEDVSKRHYAGRASASFAHEAEMLAAHRSGIGGIGAA